MREYCDFTNVRPNPYAEKMKNGYSVAIHYETPEDIDSVTNKTAASLPSYFVCEYITV